MGRSQPGAVCRQPIAAASGIPHAGPSCRPDGGDVLHGGGGAGTLGRCRLRGRVRPRGDRRADPGDVAGRPRPAADGPAGLGHRTAIGTTCPRGCAVGGPTWPGSGDGNRAVGLEPAGRGAQRGAGAERPGIAIGHGAGGLPPAEGRSDPQQPAGRRRPDRRRGPRHLRQPGRDRPARPARRRGVPRRADDARPPRARTGLRPGRGVLESRFPGPHRGGRAGAFGRHVAGGVAGGAASAPRRLGGVFDGGEPRRRTRLERPRRHPAEAGRADAEPVRQLGDPRAADAAGQHQGLRRDARHDRDARR